jgi:hypothetical protein
MKFIAKRNVAHTVLLSCKIKSCFNARCWCLINTSTVSYGAEQEINIRV